MHFIGRRAYDTVYHFANEAHRHGVQWRVSVAQIKAMSWVDRIVLAMQQKDGRTLIFGVLSISMISCVAKVSEVIVEGFPLTGIKQTAGSGQSVERACGSYALGPRPPCLSPRAWLNWSAGGDAST